MVLLKRRLGLPQLANARTGVFFFLGAGFMLIETKAITELGLVFGNTWTVTAVAVAGILLMVYAANQWILHHGPVSIGGAFLLLAATISLGWAVAVFATGGSGVPMAKLVMPLVLTAPLLFAGLIFSTELLGKGVIGSALSANLLGAVFGGFLEYNSMYWGLSSLYPLGLVLYGLAFVCFLRSRRPSNLVLATNEANSA